MKHNLLRNFLALVLSGIMLAGVGCKNYDDDIDKINNRLDELYVTVADLDEQIESVRNAIPSLDALNEEVAALRSELDGVKTDVASIDQKLEAIGDVQAKLNGRRRRRSATNWPRRVPSASWRRSSRAFRRTTRPNSRRSTTSSRHSRVRSASCPPWISRVTYRSSRIA